MSVRLLLLALGKVVGFPSRVRLWTFDAATRHPQRVQEELLRRILDYHADTAFGRDHHFGSIRTVADFRKQLPVAPYEAVEPYVARVRRGETDALLADKRVLMFALTSGTTATRKFIPVTPRSLADYQRAWNRWGLRALFDHQKISCAPILQISGDMEEFRTEAGIPCGSLSGLTARAQHRYIRFLYCFPPEAGEIKDADAKHYVALRLSIGRPVGMITAANPSTLVGLARALARHSESLIRDLHDGTLNPELPIPANVRAALAPRLRPKRRRAKELEAIAAKAGALRPYDVWPPERLLIGTWTGGSVGPYLRQLKEHYGEPDVRDLGLVASEGRMTIPMADGTPAGVLDVTTHYFEFIPESEIDSPQPTVLGTHELVEGGHYFLVPTTAAGLYRYDLHDLVRVAGFHRQTPLLEFLSKGSHFASLTGEKLSEYQVTRAMDAVTRRRRLPLPVFTLAPCWDDRQPYYGLFVERDAAGALPAGYDAATFEALLADLDRELGEANGEYASKRKGDRLGPVRGVLLAPGAWPRWDGERQARRGGPAEQYKHPGLVGDLNFRMGLPVEGEVAVRDASQKRPA
jgi:GH3 auxin-responsive promoter